MSFKGLAQLLAWLSCTAKGISSPAENSGARDQHCLSKSDGKGSWCGEQRWPCRVTGIALEQSPVQTPGAMTGARQCSEARHLDLADREPWFKPSCPQFRWLLVVIPTPGGENLRVLSKAHSGSLLTLSQSGRCSQDQLAPGLASV